MIRTLIVDDETLVRATLRTLVDWEALGYTIVQDCSDGGQALEYLKRNPVDVMFTDMKMPNVGGIELLRGLKESRAAPVSIALSGYDEFELVREAFRLGAYGLSFEIRSECRDPPRASGTAAAEIFSENRDATAMPGESGHSFSGRTRAVCSGSV